MFIIKFKTNGINYLRKKTFNILHSDTIYVFKRLEIISKQFKNRKKIQMITKQTKYKTRRLFKTKKKNNNFLNKKTMTLLNKQWKDKQTKKTKENQ